eukprot:CAMPEP_0202449550 /NCGR_PEP_ID=MMETSP1360-20130828/8264_1 /ASSEMBLY_ACC=CAM_ASM_000848 /TAXON_ID=515479 /ORGANISM="Licmophora paradoxa, Strain CCMP2313" /LENGTH=39 /DNA_ID= /DNA_START= /DNA_END= /DNA_ORIENTATION=
MASKAGAEVVLEGAIISEVEIALEGLDFKVNFRFMGRDE